MTVQVGRKTVASKASVTPATYNGSTFTPPKLSGTFTVGRSARGRVTVTLPARSWGSRSRSRSRSGCRWRRLASAVRGTGDSRRVRPDSSRRSGSVHSPTNTTGAWRNAPSPASSGTNGVYRIEVTYLGGDSDRLSGSEAVAVVLAKNAGLSAVPAPRAAADGSATPGQRNEVIPPGSPGGITRLVDG